MSQVILIFKAEQPGTADTIRDKIVSQLDDQRIKVVVLPTRTEYVTTSYIDDEVLA